MSVFEDLETEKSVLATPFVNPIQVRGYMMDAVSEVLFTKQHHKELYRAITALWSKQASPTVFDVVNELNATSQGAKALEAWAGEEGLYQLSTKGSTQLEQLRLWVNRLIEIAGKRKVFSMVSSVSAALQDGSVTLSTAMATLEDLPKKVYSDGAAHTLSLTPSEIRKRDFNKPIAEYLRHGEATLDLMYRECGSRRGQYEIIMGDTGHGKSHLAILRAVRYAAQGYNVLWVQREDTDSATVRRAEAYRRYYQQIEPEKLDSLYITDRLKYISDIKREVRLRHAEGKLDVLVVDYLQRIHAFGFRGSDRRLIVDHISTELADLALELDILVICVSQLSRKDKHRKGWASKPRLSDLKESSQLEQDAFVVTSVFNPSRVPELRVHGNDSKVEWEGGGLAPSNQTMIEILKHRHGLPNIYKREFAFSEHGAMVPLESRYTHTTEVDQQRMRHIALHDNEEQEELWGMSAIEYEQRLADSDKRKARFNEIDNFNDLNDYENE